MNETIEQQMSDSDIIFTAISTGGFDDFKQAERAVTTLYIMDMTYSRSGISHALKRLEKHYADSEERMKLKKYADPNYGEPDDDAFTEEEQHFNDILDGQDATSKAVLDESLREAEKNYARAIRNRNIGLVVMVIGIITLLVGWLMP